MKNKYPKQCFTSAIFVPFENTVMPIPVGYDKYLRMAFGDYMKLPAEKDRVTEHDNLIIDTDNSYLKYKGQYYCVS